MKRAIYLGFDAREAAAYAVAVHSARLHLTQPIPIRGLVLAELRAAGLYWRRTVKRHTPGLPQQLYDPISEATMSTEFAISRFLTPLIAQSGLALFMDCDVLLRGNLARLFDLADPTKAVQVVKHQFEPDDEIKMDNQAQQPYPRKNWSSVMLFNCDHPANRALTVDLVNNLPGRDLHAFCWLPDNLIGELPVEWNWLNNHSTGDGEPQLVHFTDGIPSMPGYACQPYAGEWFEALHQWASWSPVP